MQTSPFILLILLVIFVFAPSIQEWVTQGGTSWYRPYVLWLLAVIIIAWHTHHNDRRGKTPRDDQGQPE